MPFTLEDWLALDGRFKAAFIGPIADNLRAKIVERMPAALEWCQYGDAGAGEDDEVLPTFVFDFNSEVGYVVDAWPVLMVIPVETTAVTEDFISQEHQIHVEVALARDISTGDTVAQGTELTNHALLYLRAVNLIILSLSSDDLVEGIDNRPGVVEWDVTGHDYGPLRQKKGTTLFLRSASCRVEVRTVEA